MLYNVFVYKIISMDTNCLIKHLTTQVKLKLL